MNNKNAINNKVINEYSKKIDKLINHYLSKCHLKNIDIEDIKQDALIYFLEINNSKNQYISTLLHLKINYLVKSYDKRYGTKPILTCESDENNLMECLNNDIDTKQLIKKFIMSIKKQRTREIVSLYFDIDLKTLNYDTTSIYKEAKNNKHDNHTLIAKYYGISQQRTGQLINSSIVQFKKTKYIKNINKGEI